MLVQVQTNDTGNLSEKAGYNAKIEEIEDKTPSHGNYVTTNDFNSSSDAVFVERLKQAK